jgi:hypothetical protein
MSHLPFSLLYLGITYALARLFKLDIEPITLAVLFLAAYRMGRAVAFNAIFAWLRAPFTKIVPHDSGADDEAVADDRHGHGLRFTIGELLTCPICSGTWAALALIAVYLVDPAWGTILIYALGVAGAAEFLNWRSEYDQWQGRAGRAIAGHHKNPVDTWEEIATLPVEREIER